MSAIEQWHEVMKDGGKEGASKLDSLLHDDVIFYSQLFLLLKKEKKSLCYIYLQPQEYLVIKKVQTILKRSYQNSST